MGGFFKIKINRYLNFKIDGLDLMHKYFYRWDWTYNIINYIDIDIDIDIDYIIDIMNIDRL